MASEKLDIIHIHDLLLRCIIGINPEEREKEQDVVIHIMLFADLRSAGRSDSIADTIDYKALKQRIAAMVEGSSYGLIEALAQKICDICLEEPRVERARVTVEKPGALRFARTVGVEIVRERNRHD